MSEFEKLKELAATLKETQKALNQMFGAIGFLHNDVQMDKRRFYQLFKPGTFSVKARSSMEYPLEFLIQVEGIKFNTILNKDEILSAVEQGVVTVEQVLAAMTGELQRGLQELKQGGANNETR